LVVFQAEEPELAQARPDRSRHPARRFPLLDVRHDLALDELPHRRAEHLVLLVEDLHPATLSSAGFAGAILVLGEASEGAVEAPADFISCCSLKIFTSETLLHVESTWFHAGSSAGFTSVPLALVADLLGAVGDGPRRHDLDAAAQLHHVADGRLHPRR